MPDVRLHSMSIGRRHPLVFFLGPCVIESRDHTLFMAEKIKEIAEKPVSYTHLTLPTN